MLPMAPSALNCFPTTPSLWKIGVLVPLSSRRLNPTNSHASGNDPWGGIRGDPYSLVVELMGLSIIDGPVGTLTHSLCSGTAVYIVRSLTSCGLSSFRYDFL